MSPLLPSWVLSDHGMENTLVALMMNIIRGLRVTVLISLDDEYITRALTACSGTGTNMSRRTFTYSCMHLLRVHVNRLSILYFDCHVYCISPSRYVM